MSLFAALTSTVVLLGCAYWVLVAVGAIKVLRALPVLADQRPEELARWPKLSVIIPACNEGATLEAAMRSKLAEDYPAIEFVLIDDRSSDATGAIVDRLAAEDPRVTGVHVTVLPDGWLGKLHAMHQGVGHATGEWLLFSDADVHLVRGMLRRSIALCEARGIDHLALFPEVWPGSLALDTALAAFARVVFIAGRTWAVGDPTSRVGAGIGAFNLVRRTAFDRTRGFEWLKLEVADDVALGQMLKDSGARSVIANGRGQAGLHFYGSVREMARGAEKGAALLDFRLWRALVAFVTMTSLELGPYAQLWVPGTPGWLRTACVVGVTASLFACVSLNRWMGHRLLPSLLVPIGSAMMAVITLRAGILGATRGGLVWRGTRYEASALRAGRRLRFPW